MGSIVLKEDEHIVVAAGERVELTHKEFEMLKMSASKKNVEVIIDGEAKTIYGVRRYIYEIIYNLCDNAIRYNVNGGKVNIM